MTAMAQRMGSAPAVGLEFDRRRLPGFDPFMHRSPVVDESVEEKNGRLVVVYRTKPDITKEAHQRVVLSLSRR